MWYVYKNKALIHNKQNKIKVEKKRLCIKYMYAFFCSCRKLGMYICTYIKYFPQFKKKKKKELILNVVLIEFF